MLIFSSEARLDRYLVIPTWRDGLAPAVEECGLGCWRGLVRSTRNARDALDRSPRGASAGVRAARYRSYIHRPRPTSVRRFVAPLVPSMQAFPFRNQNQQIFRPAACFPDGGGKSFFEVARRPNDVRYWPKADISLCGANVRF